MACSIPTSNETGPFRHRPRGRNGHASAHRRSGQASGKLVRGRARVALRDGSLWSLPSRVRVAPPFAAADGLAVGVGTACQQVLALSEQRLFRLELKAGEQTGTWAPVTLPAEVVSSAKLTGAPFAKSKLYSIDKDVLLVHDTGVVWRIGFGGCP